MGIADKYASVSLLWPIASVNLLLCGFFVFSVLRAHRYFAGVYVAAYNAHTEKLRLKPAARPPADR
jgi:hypothetical protein